MTYFDNIYEIAADNYGIVTTAQANNVGASNKDLTRYVHDGRLARLGHGVYQVRYWVPTEYDPYAIAVALAGDGAYLFGESVIAMHRLAPVDPSRIDVATTRRVRRRMPATIRLIKRSEDDEVALYEGIPSQSIPSAILSCRKTLMPDRLAEAAKNARERGLIRAEEKERILAKLEKQ